MPETPPIVVVLDDLRADVEAVRVARAKARAWTEIADTAMAKIKARVGEAADQGTVDGKPVVRHGIREVTRVDSKRLRADLPAEVLAPYLNTTVEHRYELLED